MNFEDDICSASNTSHNPSIIVVNASPNVCNGSNDERTEPSKGRIICNLLHINFAFFLYFTGFYSLGNLQSTMNAAKGIGPDSQAVIYLASMVSSLLLPKYLIEKFGCKYTFAFSLLVSCPYIAANFSLRWDSIMVTAVLYGLASGPLSSSFVVYVDELSIRYISHTKGSREDVESLFFGISMLFSQSTQILGNSVSYFILDKGKHDNFTQSYNCGLSFPTGSAEDTNPNLTPPSAHARSVLIGIYLLLAILSVVVALLLEPLRNNTRGMSDCRSVTEGLIGSVKHLKNPHQILLIIISMFCGFEATFNTNEFNEAFIGCSWGIQHVGYVSVCFGLVAAIVSIIVGPLVKWTSLMFVIVLVAVLNLVTYALLFVWKPSPDTPSLYFVFGGLFGCADAIWWSQLPALYGLMFPENREAAYSNFFFWSFLGYFISYTYANFLSIVIKLYILFAVLISGITCFLISHIMKKRSSTYATILESDVSE